MGIKNINSLLRSHNKTGITDSNIDNYKGKKIAVDLSNYLYKVIYRAKKANRDENHYLQLLMNLVGRIRNAGITPIFVFDGAASKNKSKTIRERIESRHKIEMRIENIVNNINEFVGDCEIDISTIQPAEMDGFDYPEGPPDTETIVYEFSEVECSSEMERDDEVLDADADESIHDMIELSNKLRELSKLSRQCLYVNHQHFVQCEKLFTLMGIPYIHAHKEADDMCGFLAKHGFIDGCMSEDTDMMAHGINLVLREFNEYSGKLQEFNLTNICNDLGFTFDQFLDTCILTGTDYCKINKIGPKTAYKMIDKFGSYEKAKDEIERKFTIPEDFNYDIIRDLFIKHENPEEYFEQIVDVDLNISDPNVDELIKFASEKCDLELTEEDIKKNKFWS